VRAARRALPGAALLLVLAACGSGSASTAGSTTTERPAPPTSVPAPAGTDVLLLGDSIMEELSDALTSGVEDGGVDRATFRLGPSLPHTPADVVLLERTLASVAPDVVVLHIGHWERLEVLGDFATGARTAPGTYRSEVVEPALDLVAATGARLLWVSPIPVEDPDEGLFVARLAGEWREALRGRAGATWVDVLPAIAPGGSFVATLPGPDGEPRAVRRGDGIHLCPDGQRRVAEVVVAAMGPLLDAPPGPGWGAAWRATVDEPGGCGDYRPGDRAAG
jgi:hypothetical protein